MSAFQLAVDVLFGNPDLTRQAVYQPAEGEAFTIRIIARRADTTTDFGDARLWSETSVFDVRVSDVPQPRPGDRLIIGVETFVVQGEPVRDRERLIWTLNTRPV